SARAPLEYPRLMIGDSRPRQERLGWWDRFQVADGWFAASARALVAAAVVGAVVVVGAQLAFHTGSASAAYERSAPMPSDQSDLIAPIYAPATPYSVEPALGSGAGRAIVLKVRSRNLGRALPPDLGRANHHAC
ncbi:MAG: hypothetical protein IPL91_14605, partial [Hyphomicrobium sp.]|nr:hypothetical protein [Hyphomicrobium sp.]